MSEWIATAVPMAISGVLIFRLAIALLRRRAE
jgi:hypothetical protein